MFASVKILVNFRKEIIIINHTIDSNKTILNYTCNEQFKKQKVELLTLASKIVDQLKERN